MDVRVKLNVLADAAKYDASCASSGGKRRGNGKGLGHTTGSGICHSYAPDGRCISLLKLLLTNYCIYDCQYCVNRISSDTPRARFTVEEVVNLTLEFYKRNYIEGLFLSSGIIQSIDYTMELLIEVARQLREVHFFNGYIHLKAVPGASEELLMKAGKYADRLSANIELPREVDLVALAPQKTQVQVETTMSSLREGISAYKSEFRKSRHAPSFAPAGQSTQMIVGATPASDTEILIKADQLYREQKLRCVYYSAFSPIPHADLRLPVLSPPLMREHRLYQADWLMRFYEFGVQELTAAIETNLDLAVDPKLAWALRNRSYFPVNLNRAMRHQLLRVPGLGVRNVNRIIHARRFGALRLNDLTKLHVVMSKVKPWIETADYSPATALLDRVDLAARVKPHEQLELFAAPQAALTGEL